MNATPATEPTRFGKYQILERIASGGMAEIFKARLDGIGGFHRTFAIKRILPNLTANPEFVDLLVEEAKIAGLLSHANIVQILDLGAVDDQYYIAMEYVHGRDLGVVLKRCAEKGITFPVPHALHTLLEMLKGLEYAHNRQVLKQGKQTALNIVHRDVSPPNVLVSFQGEVKITDFGIAKAAVRALETMSGVIKGRFDYMSPEQASGASVDRRSDLFAAGVVFYQLLTGRHPFRQASELGTVEAIRKGAFAPPSHVNPDVPPGLDRIVARALEVDPDKRYPTATAFREDLDRFLHESRFIFSTSMLASFVRGLFPEVEVKPGIDMRARMPTSPPSPTRDDVELGEDAPANHTPTLAPKRDERVAEAPALPPPSRAPVDNRNAPEPPRLDAPSAPSQAPPPPAAALPPRPTKAPPAEPPRVAPARPEPPPPRPSPFSAPTARPADHALRDVGALLKNLPPAPAPDGRDDAGAGEEATVIRPAGPDAPAAWTEAQTVIRPEEVGADATGPGPGRPSPTGAPPPPPRLPDGRAPTPLPRGAAPAPATTPAFVHLAYVLVAGITLVVGMLAGVFLERTGTVPGDPVQVRLDPVLQIDFPVGSTITLDGRTVPGTSPITVKVQPNREAVVKVARPGYPELTTRVTLDYNQMKVLSFDAIEQPQAP